MIGVKNSRIQVDDSIDAENQRIDIQWKGLSVYIGEPKKRSAMTSKVVDEDNRLPLLNKYKYSQAKYDNINAQELSRKNAKYDYKCILDNQNGFASSGQLTAIMGPSGAGKTTMLACLSQRIKTDDSTIVEANITANGSDYNTENFCNFGVFVRQDDLLVATLTVKESLMFAANMHLNGVNKLEKAQRVEQLIRDLKLGLCQHTYVGNFFIKGISGGERKRTSIGIELIANPPVLILDEPTSGLDSFTAFIIVDILKKLCKRYNRTIIMTIHQPSSDIYDLIDRLILLDDGKTTYQGPAQQLQDYMLRLNIQTPTYSNPCDHFMNELRQPNTQLTNDNYDIYLEKENQIYLDETNFDQGYLKRRINNSFLYEFNMLSRRHITNYFRNPQLLKGRVFITSFFIIFQAVLFWNIGMKHLPPAPPATSSASQINTYVLSMSAALFFLGTGSIFSAMGPLIQLFPIDRQIFLKEENSKLYRVISYFLGKISVDLPFAILTPLVQSSALYYFLGFRREFSHFFEFLLISILISVCGNGLGLFAGCLFSDAKSSAALAPIILLPLQLFGGQYTNLGNLGGWISWFQYLSPFKYFLEALIHTQLDDLEFLITPSIVGENPTTFYPLQELNMNFGLWNCIMVLAILAFSLHFFAYTFLKMLSKRITV